MQTTAITILGVFAIKRDGEQAIKPMLHLIVQGDALRMLTVIFIVSAASGLVILGKVDGQLGGTILSGVAGYVLGSGSRRPTRQGGEKEPSQAKKMSNAV